MRSISFIHTVNKRYQIQTFWFETRLKPNSLNYSFEFLQSSSLNSFLSSPVLACELPRNTNHSIKTLGIVWNPLLDKFNFTVYHVESDVNGGQFTKRQTLSDVAKVFDPLGWLTPVTLQLKHLLQKTWESRTDWDENLPKESSSAYLEWRSKLVSFRHLELDRFVLSANQSRDIALRIFCDAFEKGYAACVYVLSTGPDDSP